MSKAKEGGAAPFQSEMRSSCLLLATLLVATSVACGCRAARVPDSLAVDAGRRPQPVRLYPLRDTALHLGSTDGPPIGVLHPWSAVLLVAAHDGSGTEIALEERGGSPGLHAFVQSSDVSRQCMFVDEPYRGDCRFESPRWSSAPGSYATNMSRPMSVVPAGPPFACAACTPLLVLGEALDGQGKPWTHVSRYVDAIELVGWVPGAGLADMPGDPECAPRRIWRLDPQGTPTDRRGPKPLSALPRGYTEVAPASRVLRPVRTHLRAGNTIHLLVDRQHSPALFEPAFAAPLRCEAWTVAPEPCEVDDASAVCGDLYRAARVNGQLLRSQVGYAFAGDGTVGISLAPTLSCGDPDCSTSRVVGVSQCAAEPYAAVAADSDSIALIHDHRVDGTELWGYSPDDVQRWYLSAAACSAAAAALTHPSAIGMSVHWSAVGCLDHQ